MCIKRLLIPFIPALCLTFNTEIPDHENSNLHCDQFSYSNNEVIENILLHEYDITFDNSLNVYQSSNRTNNINFIYRDNGFTAIKDDWKIGINVVTSEKEIPPSPPLQGGRQNIGNGIITEKNTAYTENDLMRINYINNESGMRQDFIVKKKPESKENLKLDFHVNTDLKVIAKTNEITFEDRSGNQQMSYSQLKAWDSENKILDAHFESAGNSDSNSHYFSICVNDNDATYPITIDPLSSSPTRIFEINQDTAELGVSVASAGDVNGDGYGDVIMSAPYYDNGQKDEGKVYVYYGSASGLSPTANWTAESNQALALFGWSVSSAGDVNKDGYGDVIIGAPSFDNNETDEGRAYVYYGSASGLSLTPNWTTEINQNGADYGYSVCCAGDINNDGYSDVIVGSPYFDNGQSNEGKVFLYKGSASGLSTSSTWSDEGNQIDGYYGYRTAPAGDINKDGYSDLIVGAYKYDNPELNEGKVFVYYSNGTNLPATPSWTSDGNQISDYYGWTIAGGDVNGDGYSDIIIGAIQYDNGELDEGRVYEYNGSASGLSSSPSWIKEINQISAVFGCWVSLSDINRDGYSDAIIGSYLYDNGQTDEGAAFVYKGSPTGLSSTADWSAESNQQSARMGYCVADAGDVNGDGFNEVMVGSYSYSNGQSYEGSVYLFNALHVPLKLNLTMYTQGLYQTGGTFPMIQDTIKVYLQNSISPYNTKDSAKAYLSNTGFAQLNFNSTSVNLNTSYYIKLKHRNSIETWSDSARKFTNTVLNYNFTTASTKAFGINMKLVDTSPNRYGIFSGDVNSDGTIDVTDIVNIFNDANNLAAGYLLTDVNGDNFTDIADLILSYNNSLNLISKITP